MSPDRRLLCGRCGCRLWSTGTGRKDPIPAHAAKNAGPRRRSGQHRHRLPARRTDLPDRPRHRAGAASRSPSTPRSTASCRSVFFKEGQRVKKGDVLAKIDPRLYQAALDQAKAQQGAGRSGVGRGAERSGPLPDPGPQKRRNPTEPRPAAGQGRSDQSLDRCRRGRHRDRADQSRLHRHRGAERRPHGRAHGRSRQYRACQRPGRDRDPDPDPADRRHCSRCRRKRSTTCAMRWRAARSRSPPTIATTCAC